MPASPSPPPSPPSRWPTAPDLAAPVRAWVRTVALNLCRSRWRRLQRERRPLGATTLAEDEPRDTDLVAALRRLSTRQREALVLHYRGDLAVADCAAVMGISAGSVKQHLRRARAALGDDPSLAPVEDLT